MEARQNERETDVLLHPDIMAMLAHDRVRQVVTAAERRRLLTAARRARRTRPGTNGEASPAAGSGQTADRGRGRGSGRSETHHASGTGSGRWTSPTAA